MRNIKKTMPISFSNQEFQFSNEDKTDATEGSTFERWKKGALGFKEFWGQVDKRKAFFPYKERIPFTQQELIGDLEAVFFEEKPCAAIFQNIDPKLLKRYGLKKYDDSYIYSSKLVKKKMDENPDVFSEHSPEELFQYIETTDDVPTRALKLGVILGYPRSSCEKFYADFRIQEQINQTTSRLEKIPFLHFLKNRKDKNARKDVEKKLTEGGSVNIAGINFEKDRIIFNAYGIKWADFSPSSPDSVIWQNKLNRAFESSGILELVPDMNIPSLFEN